MAYRAWLHVVVIHSVFCKQRRTERFLKITCSHYVRVHKSLAVFTVFCFSKPQKRISFKYLGGLSKHKTTMGAGGLWPLSAAQGASCCQRCGRRFWRGRATSASRTCDRNSSWFQTWLWDLCQKQTQTSDTYVWLLHSSAASFGSTALQYESETSFNCTDVIFSTNVLIFFI